MATETIPLETTLIGQLKEAVQTFKKTRSNKATQYPEKIRNLSIQALEIGMPLVKVSEILGSHPSTIYGWVKNPKKKKVPKKKLVLRTKKSSIIRGQAPSSSIIKSPFPSRLEISLGIFKVVLCFQ
jgi:hypothetical protein